MTAVATDTARPLRQATVAVVLNSSDEAHFSVTGKAPFEAACPAWAKVEYVADHDIAGKLAPLLEAGDVDAVVFASNSLSTAAAQEAVRNDFIPYWSQDGPARDVGVLVLHQYLATDVVLWLDFLGSAAFSIEQTGPHRVDRGDIRFVREWLLTDDTPYKERARFFLALSDGYGKEQSCAWTRVQPRNPTHWQRLVWEHEADTLIDVCATAERTVITSRIPLDLMGSTQLLGSLIAACLRPRGCLLLRAPQTQTATIFTPALASALERGHFVHQIAPAQPTDIDLAASPYAFFDELIVAPEWSVPKITALDQDAIQRKLEQGGSIVASFAGPAETTVTVRLGGLPQYAERAHHLARWLLPQLAAFQGDLWATWGLTQAVRAAREAFQDSHQIPRALQVEFVRRHVAPRLVDRISNDNVDDNVLATLGTYAALRGLGVSGNDELRRWAERRLEHEPPSVVAQAMLLVPAVMTAELEQRVQAALKAPASVDTPLLRAYAAALYARERPELLRAAAGDPSLGLGVRAELLYAVARHKIEMTDELVELAASVRGRIDRLAAAGGALEAICVGNAALIELARHQGIGPTAPIGGRPREAAAVSIENTELVRTREEALRTAARYRLVGRQATTALAGALILMLLTVLTAILIWLDGGFTDKVKFALPIFGLLSGFVTYVVKKARAADLPPALGRPKDDAQARG